MMWVEIKKNSDLIVSHDENILSAAPWFPLGVELLRHFMPREMQGL